MFENLPIEIESIIYKKLHRLYMKDICYELTNCISWVRLKSGYLSFLIGKYNKYYNCLENFIDYVH